MKKRYIFALIIFFISICYIIISLNSQTELNYYKESAPYISDIFMKTTLLTDNENELLNNRSEIDKLVEKLKRVKKGFKTTAAQNFTNEFIDLSYNVNSLNLERVQNNNFNKQDELFERTKELFEKYEEFNNIFNQ